MKVMGKNEMETVKRINHFLKGFFTFNTFAQFYRYVLVGLVSFITEASLLYLLTDHLKLWYIYSNSIVYIIVFWLNFLLNRFWSFKSKQNLSTQLVMYLVLFVINLFASNGMLYLLTSVFNVYYLVSKIFAVALVVSWNFVIYKKVIFK